MSAWAFLTVIEDFGRAFVVDLGLSESVLLGGLGGFFLAGAVVVVEAVLRLLGLSWSLVGLLLVARPDLN